MSEGIKRAEKGPRIIRQHKRPKDKLGMKWIPVYDNFWKQDERTGWVAVSTEPAPSPPAETEGLLEKPPRKVGGITAEQLEKSRKKHFSSIEDSLPTGDKD